MNQNAHTLTLVNATCLNFKTDYLITGQAKENFQCKFEVYWSDGFNPDRVLNYRWSIPWVENCEYIDELLYLHTNSRIRL